MTKGVMKAVFLRKGGRGKKTDLFEALSQTAQSALLGSVKLGESEEPVVGYFESPEKWLLITTQGIWWRDASRSGHLAQGEVAKVDVALGESVRAGAKGKDEFSMLKILGSSGSEYVVEVEPGPPYWGLYRVVELLVSRKTSRP